VTRRHKWLWFCRWFKRIRADLMVQLVLAFAAIASLVYTGRAVRVQTEEAKIERTPVLYVACTFGENSFRKPITGVISYVGFDADAVWHAFPKMKAPNGQAAAIFPSEAVQVCQVHNYGKLPIIGLRLPIVARLIRRNAPLGKCATPSCPLDYSKAAGVEAKMVVPADMMSTTPLAIEPGGVRTVVIGNFYRQQLEFEFLPTVTVTVPPNPSPTILPLIVGSFSAAHTLPGGVDCTRPGWPRDALHQIPDCH